MTALGTSLAWLIIVVAATPQPAASKIPSSPLSFGVFTVRSAADGAFTDRSTWRPPGEKKSVPERRHIATNSMGELLMATPALSEGVLYLRSSASLFAVGRPR